MAESEKRISVKKKKKKKKKGSVAMTDGMTATKLAWLSKGSETTKRNSILNSWAYQRNSNKASVAASAKIISQANGI